MKSLVLIYFFLTVLLIMVGMADDGRTYLAGYFIIGLLAVGVGLALAIGTAILNKLNPSAKLQKQKAAPDKNQQQSK